MHIHRTKTIHNTAPKVMHGKKNLKIRLHRFYELDSKVGILGLICGRVQLPLFSNPK